MVRISIFLTTFKDMKSKLTIQFPNLLMIPVFSVIGIIMKSLGLSEYSWTSAMLTLPIVFYFYGALDIAY